MKYVLLTGATGLVGRYLIRDLLLEGQRVAVVARPSKHESPALRIEALLQFWEEQMDRALPRPVVLDGDVSESGWGMNAQDSAWVAAHCDRILHNAAVLTFHGADRNGEPWRTNLQGTEHTLRLCEQWGIQEFHYVSTAYVCGQRQGVVREDELNEGQSFRNDYEHSKFLSEQLVRAASFLTNLTIYRPTVIGGDSRTGYTSTYHGVYAYLKLMSVICRNVPPGPDGVRHTPVQLQMTGDEPRNLVPVDWVSAAICRIFRTPKLHGRTYHLAPREPVTPRQVISAGYTYFNSRGVEFVGPGRKSGDAVSTLDQAAKENMTMYEPYETTDPCFDTENLDRYLHDLPCPRVDEAMLHQFWQYGERDRWGKRRAPKAKVPFWVADVLKSQLVAHDGSERAGARRNGRLFIGLDVMGPGGGQWQLGFGDGQLVSCEWGLPVAGPVIVRMSASDFARLMQKHEGLTAELLLSTARSCASNPGELHRVLGAEYPAGKGSDWLAGSNPVSERIAAASRIVDGR